MKPHSWSINAEEDAASNRMHPPKDPNLHWFQCAGCGALIIADSTKDPATYHTSWQMSPDCDEQVVTDVMED